MQPGSTFFKLVTLATGIAFSALGSFGMFLPTVYIRILEVDPTSSSLNNHFRYLNALFLVFGLMLFALYRDHRKNHNLLLYLTIGMLLGAAVRAWGIVVNGLPNWVMIVALVGELVLGIVYGSFYRNGIAA